MAKAITVSKRPLARLVWNDAHMSMDEFTMEDVQRDMHRPEQVVTYGLLVQDDAMGVTLAMEEGVTDGKFRHLTFVPRGMVVELVVLSVSKPRARKSPAKTNLDPQASGGESQSAVE